MIWYTCITYIDIMHTLKNGNTGYDEHPTIRCVSKQLELAGTVCAMVAPSWLLLSYYQLVREVESRFFVADI